MEPVPALVTLHVWRVPRSAVPAALARLALDRSRARHTPGVRFAKMLGTGRDFSLRHADPTRWAKLATWTQPGPDPVAQSWERLAEETLRLDLLPLASTGQWSRRTPFGAPGARRTERPVAALTRARLRPTRIAAFSRAVPAVQAELARSAGLTAALAVGEAPVGLQGTFSLWRSEHHLRAFTQGEAHRQAVRDTTRHGWYAEELFARFEVLGGEGTLDGRQP